MSPIKASRASCWVARKMPQIDVDSDAYQKAGPTQWEVSTLPQEKDAVTTAVKTVA